MATKTTTQPQQNLMTDLLDEAGKMQARAIDEAAATMKQSLELSNKMVQSSQRLAVEAVRRVWAFNTSVLND